MQRKRLAPGEREFLQLVRRAIFANPFGEERTSIDCQILGDAAAADTLEREALLARKVGERLTGREVRLREYEQEDRTLLEYSILFTIYHQYCAQLDDHIVSQLAAGDTPVAVDFAPECLGRIGECGFGAGEATRYFSLFFQMRRAFFFINRIVGKSPSVTGLRLSLWNNLFTHDIGLYDQYLWNRMEDFATLLLGETGTGKGMAAAAIGRAGFIPFNAKKQTFAESFTRAFLPINLSQFPEQLLDSELFGHRKGSFTGAIDNHQGVLERSSPYGAIFLDEIGEVSGPVQIKLLKVLEERLFSPVGSHEVKRFPGRIVAATNRDLGAMRRDGVFRDDFYYRLCSDTIWVPPLRERLREDPAELRRLLEVTVERITGQASPDLAELVEKTLLETVGPGYSWPGNVRELEQAVRRVLLTRDYAPDVVLREEAAAGTLARRLEEGTFDAQGLLAEYCTMLFERHGTYEEVARIARLDRRTAKKYVCAGQGETASFDRRRGPGRKNVNS